MKFHPLLPILTLAMATPIWAQQESKPAQKPEVKTEAAAEPTPVTVPPLDAETTDKVSYMIGSQIGNSLKRDGITINFEVFNKAVQDAVKGDKGKYSEEELAAAGEKFQEHMMAKQAVIMAEAQGKAAKLLEENGKRKEVTTTASGLQYEVLKKAEGAKPKATDSVKVHYHGTLPDGTVFDSSVDRGEPVTFPLDQVIAGWTEGVQLMPVGSKFKFFIPAKLGYGDAGSPPKIAPNTPLIFEVELLGIEK